MSIWDFLVRVFSRTVDDDWNPDEDETIVYLRAQRAQAKREVHRLAAARTGNPISDLLANRDPPRHIPKGHG